MKNKKFSFARLSKGALVALICILAVVIILAGALVGAFFALKTAGKASLSNRRDDESKYEFDPNAITFEGKRYIPRNDLTTFLFMGVDTGQTTHILASDVLRRFTEWAEKTGMTLEEYYADWVRKQEEKGESTDIVEVFQIPPEKSGQADVLLLIVLDEKAKKADIISIDRNSMSYFEAFDPMGNSMGVSEAQLCLAYSYGDGAHDSCKKTVSAVSDFLYEIPIHAYYSMKYMALREVNDAVGGVEVEIKDDMTVVDERLVLGERVLLDGELAEKYLTARGNVGSGSNEERLSRHKEYIMSFIGSAVKAVKKDLGLPFELYNKIADNSVTDLSVDEIVYLATLATELEISFHSIDGTTDTSGSLDEFRPDEDALWQMILDTFYICEE
ncbi:MAG: LCP family protein [Clostridia bacterium]|nr:LCP family protein [Clostridia bacterium]